MDLYAGDIRLGTLRCTDVDWPRSYYDFDPAPGYDAFRDLLDLRGSPKASPEVMEAAEKIDLRVLTDDGRWLRLRFVFIDGNKAVIREGMIRRETGSTPCD